MFSFFVSCLVFILYLTPSNGQYYFARCRKCNLYGEPVKSCHYKDEKLGLRCCNDAETECRSFRVNFGLEHESCYYESLTWNEAHANCGTGYKLCSSTDKMAELCDSTGCQFDNMKIWSEEECYLFDQYYLFHDSVETVVIKDSNNLNIAVYPYYDTVLRSSSDNGELSQWELYLVTSDTIQLKNKKTSLCINVNPTLGADSFECGDNSKFILDFEGGNKAKLESFSQRGQYLKVNNGVITLGSYDDSEIFTFWYDEWVSGQ